MYMISWIRDRHVMTVGGDHESIRSLALIFEALSTKYKVSDRLGLIEPSDLGMGDMHHWITEAELPLY